eukprot:jgi/Galph1/722/GphlegSOOS_G5486.1
MSSPSASVNTITQLVSEENEEEVKKEIAHFRRIYETELKKEVVDPLVVFQFAAVLIRSKHRKEVKEAVSLFKVLIQKQYQPRESLFYLSLGHYKLGDTVAARREVKQFLSQYPESRQGSQLLQLVEGKLQRDAYLGMGILGAFLVGLGGIAIAAFSKENS